MTELSSKEEGIMNNKYQKFSRKLLLPPPPTKECGRTLTSKSDALLDPHMTHSKWHKKLRRQSGVVKRQ